MVCEPPSCILSIFALKPSFVARDDAERTGSIFLNSFVPCNASIASIMAPNHLCLNSKWQMPTHDDEKNPRNLIIGAASSPEYVILDEVPLLTQDALIVPNDPAFPVVSAFRCDAIVVSHSGHSSHSGNSGSFRFHIHTMSLLPISCTVIWLAY